MMKRTKALAITPAVKQRVRERDNGMCVLCGRPGDPVCHFISRAQGGLGIEENIWTGCVECHRDYDQSPIRYLLRERLVRHFRSKYPEWDKTELTYRKGM
jgi:5-methylcytosine-specific restriction endonuclease McrA